MSTWQETRIQDRANHPQAEDPQGEHDDSGGHDDEGGQRQVHFQAAIGMGKSISV